MKWMELASQLLMENQNLAATRTNLPSTLQTLPGDLLEASFSAGEASVKAQLPNLKALAILLQSCASQCLHLHAIIPQAVWAH